MTSEHRQGPNEAELLQAWLSSRDVPCPVCDYNLRSIDSMTCPECGAKLDLRVGSTDLRIGLWLVGVLALSLSLGFLGLYSILFGVPMVVTGALLSAIFLLYAVVPAAISIAYALLLWRLIRGRKKFWAKPRKAQKVSVVLYILAASAPVTIPILIWLALAL